MEEMMVTAKDILNANKYGLQNPNDYAESYTPVLGTAMELGQKGIDLSGCKIVTGYRYGKASVNGISFNFREQYTEAALSMAKIEGEEENYSACYFSGKKIYEYTGFLLNERGSDGEALIVPFGEEFENYGF